MTIREQLEQDKVLEEYYYFVQPFSEEEFMEDRKKEIIKRLGEIKAQLECLKYQKNALNVEYENMMLELWELLPGVEEKKEVKIK
ncbi:MAG: hypothetical protein IKN65_00650 [Clostridia bacterium]|nr:hypothetical protein [Bacilli bacterium]MBR3672792.1 hypothetical protein [Clostridia bacterium]